VGEGRFFGLLQSCMHGFRSRRGCEIHVDDDGYFNLYARRHERLYVRRQVYIKHGNVATGSGIQVQSNLCPNRYTQFLSQSISQSLSQFMSQFVSNSCRNLYRNLCRKSCLNLYPNPSNPHPSSPRSSCPCSCSLQFPTLDKAERVPILHSCRWTS
jgi:hypothetical protein